MISSDRIRAVAHRLSVSRLPRHDWTLIFIHIPKTAGTSLRQAIGQAYEPDERLYLYDAMKRDRAMPRRDFVVLPEDERAELRFIMGHIPFGLHQHVPREARYVTVLRDPVDRVVSHYYHYRHVARAGDGSRSAEERRLIESEDVSLQEWVFDLRRVEADNRLVRYISGRLDVPYGACTDSMLTQALENIEEHFEMVLFAEDMPASVRALGSRLGFFIPMKARANVNLMRPGKTDLDPRVLDRIRELNRLDMRLYETMFERYRAESASRTVRWLKWERASR